MYKLWLPNKELRTKKIEVPNLEEPIALNIVVLKGIQAQDVAVGDMVNVWEDQQCTQTCWGRARIFEVKHMVLGDLSRYKILLGSYYHCKDAGKSFKRFMADMKSQYDGILEGEIVTVVFFTPEQDLIENINGTGSTKKDSQSTEQA